MPNTDILTFISRTNTVCVDIKEVHPSPRVPQDDWIGLMKKEFGLKVGEVVEAQVHSLTNMLMIKLSNGELYEQLLEKLRVGVMWEKFSKKVYGWSSSDHLTTVKVINYTTHIKIENLVKKMGEFGTVATWRLGELRDFPGTGDGTVIFKMSLNQGSELPAFIEAPCTGEILHIFCDSMQKVCFKCLEKGHIAPFCRKKMKILDKKAPPPKSWAFIVQSGSGASQETGAGSGDSREDLEKGPGGVETAVSLDVAVAPVGDGVEASLSPPLPERVGEIEKEADQKGDKVEVSSSLTTSSPQEVEDEAGMQQTTSPWGPVGQGKHPLSDSEQESQSLLAVTPVDKKRREELQARARAGPH